MSSLEPVPAAVVYDVNVLVTAAASGNSPFRSWPSPPPVSGNASADCLGVIVDAAEFALWLSPHIIIDIDGILAQRRRQHDRSRGRSEHCPLSHSHSPHINGRSSGGRTSRSNEYATCGCPKRERMTRQAGLLIQINSKDYGPVQGPR